MTKNDETSLSSKQLKALPIFASQPRVDKACEQAGVSRNCYYEWMKDPVFEGELEKLRLEIRDGYIESLKTASKDATNTLIQLMGNDQPPAVRRAAANDILNHLSKIKQEERAKAENEPFWGFDHS